MALENLTERRSRIEFSRTGRIIERTKVFPDGRRLRLSAYTYDSDDEARWAVEQLRAR